MIRFIALTAALILFAAAPAAAETSIAVIDVQAVLTQSDAAKSIETQITAYKDKILDELTKQEQSLRESESVLSQERATLTKEAFAEKAKLLEEKFIQIGSLTQNKKRILDKASSTALDQVREKLYAVVQAIAKKKNYSLVITKQYVIVGEQSLDITSEAMGELNKQMPSVQLEFSEEQ